jgi:hypothetical protein
MRADVLISDPNSRLSTASSVLAESETTTTPLLGSAAPKGGIVQDHSDTINEIVVSEEDYRIPSS